MIPAEFEKRKNKLEADIDVAFGQVALADGISLHQAVAIDDRKSSEEQKAVRGRDTYKRWQDIPDQDIRYCCSALSFFDVKGFRFHLPAYMRLAVRDFPADPDDIRNSCEFHLTQEGGLSLRKSDPRRIVALYEFTSLQVQAIASFLRFVSDYDDNLKTAPFLEAVTKWESITIAG
jgi:hypothetical protein